MKCKSVMCVLGLMAFMLGTSTINNDVYADEVVECESISTVKLDAADSVSSGVSAVIADVLSSPEISSKEEETVTAMKPLTYDIAGYVTDYVNVRSNPSMDADVVDTLVANKNISYSQVTDKWVAVQYEEEKTGYIYSEYVSNGEKPNASTVWIPEHKDFKSFMPYTSISSYKQYDLQQVAYTADYGMRKVEGRYCVAVGTACNAEVGDIGEIILENGVSIPVIIGDIKDDRDTQANNLITSANGCASEFIVDYWSVPYEIRDSGSMSNCYDEWQSKVVQIKIYEGCNFFSNN